MKAGRERRGFISLNRSPLARKIITFNLMAMIVLVAGVLYLNPFRNSLVLQRESGLVAEAQLIADVFEAQLDRAGPVNLVSGDGIDVAATTAGIELPTGVELLIYDTTGQLVSSSVGMERPPQDKVEGLQSDSRSTVITDILNAVWETIAKLLAPANDPNLASSPEDLARDLIAAAQGGATQVHTSRDENGNATFTVATPIRQKNRIVGVAAVTSFAGEIDQLVRVEREQVLQMFVVAIIVSIGLSLVLASTIANPLSDLAAAAELGRDKNARKMSPSRVRIPDLTARPDEIGRLSGAMRGMVAALYE
ncbi:MAG: sensor N-terminal transmembrane domain-containing protein, partial [Paracoccaceae bacterium]